jgi:hypothetical protein
MTPFLEKILQKLIYFSKFLNLFEGRNISGTPIAEPGNSIEAHMGKNSKTI